MELQGGESGLEKQTNPPPQKKVNDGKGDSAFRQIKVYDGSQPFHRDKDNHHTCL